MVLERLERFESTGQGDGVADRLGDLDVGNVGSLADDEIDLAGGGVADFDLLVAAA